MTIARAELSALQEGLTLKPDPSLGGQATRSLSNPSGSSMGAIHIALLRVLLLFLLQVHGCCWRSGQNLGPWGRCLGEKSWGRRELGQMGVREEGLGGEKRGLVGRRTQQVEEEDGHMRCVRVLRRNEEDRGGECWGRGK